MDVNQLQAKLREHQSAMFQQVRFLFLLPFTPIFLRFFILLYVQIYRNTTSPLVPMFVSYSTTLPSHFPSTKLNPPFSFTSNKKDLNFNYYYYYYYYLITNLVKTLIITVFNLYYLMGDFGFVFVGVEKGFLDDQFSQLQKLQDESTPDFVLEVVTMFFDDSENLLKNMARCL